MKKMNGAVRKRRYINLLIGCIIIGVLILAAIFADFIAPFRYDDAFLQDQLQSPNSTYLFGTDAYGRDVFSRVIYGTRIALKIAGISVTIQLVIGLFIGLLSGFFGGVVDRICTFIMDVVWSIPSLVMAFAVVTLLGTNLLNAIMAVALVGWVQYARIVRAKTMTIRSQAFIETGIAFGESTFAILFRYILPNLVPALVVVASTSIPSVITSTTVLSFLGLGASAPSPDWGLALSENMARFTVAPWLSIFPGLALVLTTFGFTMLGEGLRDLLDPRLKT